MVSGSVDGRVRRRYHHRVFRSLTSLAVVLFAAAASACATSSAVPRPFPAPATPQTEVREPEPQDPPAPQPEPPELAVADRDALTGTALSLQGIPYRDGGSDPSGFDCSGFTQWVFRQRGLVLPRDVKRQFEEGMPVKKNDIEPGDLVFFSTVAPGASHVGIALGSDEFVHAPSSSGVVRVERLSATYWAKRLVGARRIN
jgi:cell wall-associated NlpC family hydrolase